MPDIILVTHNDVIKCLYVNDVKFVRTHHRVQKECRGRNRAYGEIENKNIQNVTESVSFNEYFGKRRLVGKETFSATQLKKIVEGSSEDQSTASYYKKDHLKKSESTNGAPVLKVTRS